jgi:hypothetical protein
MLAPTLPLHLSTSQITEVWNGGDYMTTGGTLAPPVNDELGMGSSWLALLHAGVVVLESGD